MAADVSRKESMSPDGYLRLHVQDDGDVIVEVAAGNINGGLDSYRSAAVEFCTPFGGGGGSAMDELTKRGLMEFAGRKSFVPDAYYKLTPAGRLYLTRQREAGNMEISRR